MLVCPFNEFGIFIAPLAPELDDLSDEDKFRVPTGCEVVGVDFLKNRFKFAIELCLVGALLPYDTVDSAEDKELGEPETIGASRS